ncbi:MAG TPA: 4-hydroxy-tetrahydrodipicolinate synthase [Gemmatimonadaceae bacterium]|nr:4-hydroxy-tetrahydrodipicolinate synthase [Gemmatimonadaceae bacterium]
MSAKLFGCGTALVTPFRPDGAVDEQALRALVDWQIEQGVHFLVPCGSTGEAATLTPDEHKRVVSVVVDQARGRVPICAGAGSNDTQKAIALSHAMQEAGATHLLHVSPMYNKPPQRGIVAHFRAIAAESDLPIVVYNVPGRTASNIEASTALELATIPGIVAIKEASGNLAQISDIIRERPAGFAVLSGDDSMTLGVMALGGEGIISVVSNAIPGPLAAMCNAALAGKWDEARALHHRLTEFMTAAFVESNPIPVKAALAMLGRAGNVLRLPLVPLSAQHEGRVRSGLEAAGAL